MAEKRTITIFGTSRGRPGDADYDLARELGRRLAQAGYAIANGGYGGTMTAAAEGASQAGGEVIGVTCSAFGRSGPNEHITREINTTSLDQRLARLVELGDAYIVLRGGTGTLLELAEVWETRNKGLAMSQKPIVTLGTFWQGLIELMSQVDPNCRACICPAHDVDEVLEILDKHFREPKKELG